jgi:soluble epoxide hydrolase/lipid-phosphate phosphatase
MASPPPPPPLDKLTPTDTRVAHKFAILNGHQYHYLQADPPSPPRATIFLIHGWPDLSFGWRYQIPLLQSMGLRVIAPDMLGYGRSAAPEALEAYTQKRAADDMATLARAIGAPQIIVLGHDWGGMIIWKMALWHPDLVVAAISICTPYAAPLRTYVSLEDMTRTALPNFRYQLQLAGPDVQARIQGTEKIRQFLNAMYGGSGKTAGLVGFTAEEGVVFENLAHLRRTRLLTAAELDFYAAEYSRTGMRGPLNWYRTRELNYKDELPLAQIKDLKIRVPTLFVQALHDAAIPPHMAKGMSRHFTDLRVETVDAHHWALWEATAQVNGLIQGFVERFLEGKVKAVL